MLYRWAIPLAAVFLFAATSVTAGPMRLWQETDQEVSINEVFEYSLNSVAGLFSPLIMSTSSGYFDWTVPTSFSIAGLAHDGNQYHLLLESGNDVFYHSFDTYSDVQGTSIVSTSSGFFTWTLGNQFSIAGLAYDNTQFHMLIESDNDVFYYSFDTFDDLKGSSIVSTSSGFFTWTLGNQYSIAGLTYDGMDFYMLIETDDDTTIDEVFYYSFDTFDDLKGSAIVSTGSGFFDWGVDPPLSIRAIATEKQNPTSVRVPVPPAMPLVLVGFTLIGLAGRNRRITHGISRWCRTHSAQENRDVSKARFSLV